MHVRPVNDPPTIHGPEGNRFTGQEDSKIPLSTGGGILINDRDELDFDDEDFMEVRVTVKVGALRLPWSHAGGLHLLHDELDGSPEFAARGRLDDLNHALQWLTYLASADWHGEDQINVWISDLGDGIGANPLEATASFVLSVEAVDDAPKIRIPGIVHFLEEDTLLAINFLNISDADKGSILTLIVEPDHGVVELMQNIKEGEAVRNAVQVSRDSSVGGLILGGMAGDVAAAAQMLIYHPPKNFAGQVTLSVSVTDETELKAENDVYLYVRAINDPPEIHLPGDGGTPTIQVRAGGSGDALAGIIITDVDVGDSPDVCSNIMGREGRNILSLTFSPVFGTVSMLENRAFGVWIVDATIAGPQKTMVLRGSLESLQFALDEGDLLYSAPATFSGRDTVAIELDDGGNCGSGGEGSETRILQVDVKPYEPPISVRFDSSTPADDALYTREEERLVLPNVSVTGGSIKERDAVDVVVLAVSGNITLHPSGLDEVKVLDGTGTSGARLRVRGSPAALRTALGGMSFKPRPNFYGCWDRNSPFADDTPVRSPRVRGAQALARVFTVGTPQGEGVDVGFDDFGVVDLESGGLNIKQKESWSISSLRISVGWLNDPPTVDAPESIIAPRGSLESLVAGIRVTDPDVNDAPEGRGRLDVSLWTSKGGRLALDDMVALRNGLRNDAIDEHQVRLKGRPEYINNALETLKFSSENAVNSAKYADGALVDEIFVRVNDLGFSGGGGERLATTYIVVKAGPPTLTSDHKHDFFHSEKVLPLVRTEEDSPIALPGFGTAFAGVSNSEESTVIISAREGRLSLGPHGEEIATATAEEEWEPAVTRIEITGGAEKTLPEVQVSRQE